MDEIFIFGAKYLYLLSIVIAIIYLYKSGNYKKREVIIFIFITLALTYVLGMVARELYYNPRPFVVSNIEPLIPHEPDNGFPSDHVLLVAAIASSIMFLDKKTAYWLLGITLVVAISRVYVGIHHSLDVVAAILIALICAFAVHVILAKKGAIIQDNAG